MRGPEQQGLRAGSTGPKDHGTRGPALTPKPKPSQPRKKNNLGPQGPGRTKNWLLGGSLEISGLVQVQIEDCRQECSQV